MAGVIARRRGKKWEYRFEGAHIGGETQAIQQKRVQYQKRRHGSRKQSVCRIHSNRSVVYAVRNVRFGLYELLDG